MRSLAIDPGRTGAAVLAEPSTGLQLRCIYACKWSPRRNGGYTVRTHKGGSETADDLYHVSRLISLEAKEFDVLVVEGLFAPPLKPGENIEKYRGKVSRQLTLAQAKGEMMASLRGRAPVLFEPDARTWRAKVLRCGNKKRRDAERYAIRVVPTHIVTGLDRLAGNVHVCEAAAMAWYGWAKTR